MQHVLELCMPELFQRVSTKQQQSSIAVSISTVNNQRGMRTNSEHLRIGHTRLHDSRVLKAGIIYTKAISNFVGPVSPNGRRFDLFEVCR